MAVGILSRSAYIYIYIYISVVWYCILAVGIFRYDNCCQCMVLVSTSVLMYCYIFLCFNISVCNHNHVRSYYV